MIYEPRSGALYANDGEFLRTVHCPLALRVSELAELPDSSPDKQCNACGKTIKCADDWTDDDMRKALEDFPSLCVFATTAAKNIVVLKPIGRENPNEEDLPVVHTARSIDAMEDGFRRGYRLVIKQAGQFSGIGPKCKVFQHKVTGEVWCTGDYRSELPDHGVARDWELVADWFHHRADLPFPLAAYLVPRGIRKGQRVYLEDLIEDVPVEYWNQGDSHRLVSCAAVWNGDDFDLERFEAPPEMIG